MQVKVTSINEKNGWYNLKDENGKEIAVFADKAPTVKAQIETIKAVGSGTVEMELKEKDGKTYGWDVKANQSGGKSFTPKDTKKETALLAASKLGTSAENTLQIAEKYYAWLK